MTVVAGSLDTSQIAEEVQDEEEISNAGQAGAIDNDQFVFFAAFDGTNNDIDDVELSGNPQDTNVAELYKQATAVADQTQYVTKYYPGPGTDGSLTASSWLPPEVTQEAINTATLAYNDFCTAAADWVQTHPFGDVQVALTSFSRGDAAAALFSQLLYEKGLPDPDRPDHWLIPPGEIGVSAGILFDPVTTGVNVNLAFSPTSTNIVAIEAENEYRYLFKAADYSNDPAVTTIGMYGNHCDIGGGYDNGIGALSLEAATNFFLNSGLPLANIDNSRIYDNSTPLAVHDESIAINGSMVTQLWDESASFIENAASEATRLVQTGIEAPAINDGLNESLTAFNNVSISATNSIETYDLTYNVKHVAESNGITADIYEHLDADTKVKMFLVTNTDGSQEYVVDQQYGSSYGHMDSLYYIDGSYDFDGFAIDETGRSDFTSHYSSSTQELTVQNNYSDGSTAYAYTNYSTSEYYWEAYTSATDTHSIIHDTYYDSTHLHEFYSTDTRSDGYFSTNDTVYQMDGSYVAAHIDSEGGHSHTYYDASTHTTTITG